MGEVKASRTVWTGRMQKPIRRGAGRILAGVTTIYLVKYRGFLGSPKSKVLLRGKTIQFVNDYNQT